MRVLTLTLIALFTLTNCAVKNQSKQNSIVKENTVMKNQEADYNGGKIWLGEINEDNFSTENYAWYSSNFQTYEVNKSLVDSFKSKLKDFDVKVFMGTWCGDSKRETPKFFKIMDYAGFPDSEIKMYGVNRSKKSLSGEEEGLNIRRVPTFVFYKNGEEVGRIVESPINSLEEDIRDIVMGNPQTPNYAE